MPRFGETAKLELRIEVPIIRRAVVSKALDGILLGTGQKATELTFNSLKGGLPWPGLVMSATPGHVGA